MHPKDKITKSSWTLHESVKDAISSNIIAAIHGGQLKVEAASVEKLLSLIASSADEGYHRGARVFSKLLDAAFEETTRDAQFDAEVSTSSKVKAKKK
jgi:hypothetical protein